MKLRIGIAGLRRGRTWINIFSQDNRSDVVALCDIDQSLLEEFSADEKFTDFGDLLAMNLDAIVVCTPPACHAEQTVLALGSGKHVLCEVPVATTIGECQQIVEAVNKSGKIICWPKTVVIAICISLGSQQLQTMIWEKSSMLRLNTFTTAAN
ncbi:TPA: Gfo/Idh/MocA family oxidoreductase [Candidatus Poribacteria bacterium]|nr:Gfo/Idh/MocA family oxidoreductase [Candidatus Poribacteria bacterium]HIC19193.1 Gfo/Idh/MocA family oxidoreductase [Candidatus Poribacteria bacterium]